jgi:hypothetical protein
MKMINNIIGICSVIISYSAIAAISYMGGYWGEFKINAFSFVSAKDIVVNSINPLLFSIPPIIFSVIYVHISDLMRQKSKWKNFIFTILDILVFLLLIYLIFQNLFNIWYFLGALLLLLFSYFIASLNFLKTYMPVLRNRVLIIFITTLLPFYLYLSGITEAHKIMDEEQYSYVSSPIKDYQKNRINNLKYLGRIGDSFFLYISSKKEVMIIPVSKCENLIICYVSNEYKYFDIKWFHDSYDLLKRNIDHLMGG